MGIRKIEVYSATLHYKEPFTISAGVSIESRNIIVKIETDYDVTGWGEASPSKRVTNETPETIIAALDKTAPKLIGMCPLCVEQTIEAMDKTLGVDINPSAKAAVDIALHDIIGKTTRKPLFMLLGGYRREVLTDITLSIKPPEEMAKDAAKAVKEGFKALKVKVGVSSQEDVERIRLIRDAAGADTAIRVDANQGWTVEEAIHTLDKLHKYDVEFAEQPIKAGNIRDMAKVKRNSPIPIMADESVHSPEDALALIREDAVDLINIKLMKSGGIHKARKIAAVAEAANVACMIGCMGESALGIAAATHFAAGVRNVKHADLDCDLLLKERLVVRGCVKLENSKRIPSWKNGLGATRLDEALLGKPLRSYS